MRLTLAVRPFGSVDNEIVRLTFRGSDRRRLLREAMRQMPPAHDIAWVRVEPEP